MVVQVDWSVATPSRNLDRIRTRKQRYHHITRTRTHRSCTGRTRHRRASAPRGTASPPMDGVMLKSKTMRGAAGLVPVQAAGRLGVRFYRLRLATRTCSSRFDPEAYTYSTGPALQSIIPHRHTSTHCARGCTARLDSRGSPATRRARQQPRRYSAGVRRSGNQNGLVGSRRKKTGRDSAVGSRARGAGNESALLRAARGEFSSRSRRNEDDLMSP